MCLGSVAVYLPCQFYLLHMAHLLPEWAEVSDVDSVLTFLIWAMGKTALCEEVLFRGVVLHTVQKFFGFWVGNIVQSLLFAGVHALILTDSSRDPVIAYAVPLIVSVFLFSLLIGLLNRKYGSGSIFPGWMVHACGNVAARFYVLLWVQ